MNNISDLPSRRTGSPKNVRLGRRLGGTVIGILRMKGPSMKTNIRKISVMLTVLLKYQSEAYIYFQECIYKVK